MRNLAHHIQTDDEVVITVRGVPTCRWPELWEFQSPEKVILYSGPRFEAKKGSYYSTREAKRSEARIKVEVGDHILILLRNERSTKIAVFKILMVEKKTLSDNNIDFHITIRRVYFTARTVIDDTIDPNLRTFLSRSIRISVDPESNLETLYSIPWDTFKTTNRKAFISDFNYSVKHAPPMKSVSLNEAYRLLREGSEREQFPVIVRYLTDSKGKIHITVYPLDMSVKQALKAIDDGDIRQLAFDKDKEVSINAEDQTLYILDRILTFNKSTLSELVDYINNSVDGYKSGDKTGFLGTCKSAIRIYKK